MFGNGLQVRILGVFCDIKENVCLVAFWSVERRRALSAILRFLSIRPPPIGYCQSAVLKGRVYKPSFCAENSPESFSIPNPFLFPSNPPLLLLLRLEAAVTGLHRDWTPPTTATTAIPHSSPSFGSDWRLQLVQPSSHRRTPPTFSLVSICSCYKPGLRQLGLDQTVGQLPHGPLKMAPYCPPQDKQLAVDLEECPICFLSFLGFGFEDATSLNYLARIDHKTLNCAF
ncbi:hypothetical protein MRB53_002370 [Persea americana]|uniref:Uncharacterized protein n=1 Tax=Persea americana TaxID=3435 RepID=A0ACC2MU61_PERAE|nr:hypothetical protein MRB53_002370 [Persea americana]